MIISSDNTMVYIINSPNIRSTAIRSCQGTGRKDMCIILILQNQMQHSTFYQNYAKNSVQIEFCVSIYTNIQNNH